MLQTEVAVALFQYSNVANVEAEIDIVLFFIMYTTNCV